jgi:uncharacterized protein (DUF58 family)
LLALINLNLFYCPFILEKCHELILGEVRFGDVFDVDSAFLFPVVVFLVLLVLVSIIVIVLAVLWTLVVVFLYDWGWRYPWNTRLDGRNGRGRREERSRGSEGGIGCHRLSVRFVLILYLIILGDTLVKFGFFGGFTRGDIFFPVGV